MAAVVLQLQQPQCQCIEIHPTLLEQGLATGTDLAEVIAETDILKTVSAISGKLLPFLKVIGPSMSLVLAFIPSEPQTVTLLKQLMNDIEAQFTKVTKKLDTILNEMQWDDCGRVAHR